MKLALAVWLSSVAGWHQFAAAQGTFTYDQQSADETIHGEFPSDINANQPMGQSFTPSLNAVNFVRFKLMRNSMGTAGATLYVNLREDSIDGNVLAVSLPLTIPADFLGYTNFFFPALIPVTPGTTYLFQPVIQFGDSFAIESHNDFQYAGGMMFLAGQSSRPAFDLWFREGIYDAPEPSSVLLIFCGFAALMFLRRRTLNFACDGSIRP